MRKEVNKETGVTTVILEGSEIVQILNNAIVQTYPELSGVQHDLEQDVPEDGTSVNFNTPKVEESETPAAGENTTVPVDETKSGDDTKTASSENNSGDDKTEETNTTAATEEKEEEIGTDTEIPEDARVYKYEGDNLVQVK